MSFRRRMMRAANSKPYDAEIEYLESSGTQWIDTQLSSMASYIVNCEIMALNNSQGCVFGAGTTNPNSYNGFWVDTQTTRRRLALYYPNRSYYSVTENNSFYENRIYNLEITLANTNKCIIGGINSHLNNVTISSFGKNNITDTMHLFVMMRVGQRIVPFVGRIYKISVLNNTTLEKVIDFIPVRKGNLGYMYDKVSGQLFGNSGTGNFILGNDVN